MPRARRCRLIAIVALAALADAAFAAFTEHLVQVLPGVDSGLLVDSVACEPLLAFVATFESGNAYGWDVRAGWTL